jgi:hypothetical protein
MPWTGRTWRKRLPEWTGVVVATSDFGIKVVDGGGWLNWSLPTYRGTPFDTVRQGDKVRIEYNEVEKDGKKNTYISVIENLFRPQETPVLGSVFPPGQDFPPDEEFPGAAPGSPSETPVDRQTSIVRQTCIKAAAMSLQHATGDAQEKSGAITYLAGVLEDWVNR